MTEKSNNKRIAKNTAMLYFRMLLLMFVNLYSSRIVLSALGVEDYGLYSLVGGIVVFLGFINTSVTTASQRFLSFSLGNGDKHDNETTFNSVFRAHALIALVLLLIAETLGVFYIQYFLNCDRSSIMVAHIVFQFSLMSFLVKTISVPYTASIIAHENMNVFALFSIMEGGLQLLLAILLPTFTNCRLIIYAFGMFLTMLCVQTGYRFYCKRKYCECVIRKDYNKEQIREIFQYSGWNLLGALSSVAIDQGVNMILNVFFGVVVNAARGIAFQVSTAVTSLAGNFQQALNPQIVKTYAREESDSFYMLILVGTRLSFFLLLFLAFPIFCNLHEILEMWLVDVPEYTETFCRLVLVNSLICTFSNSILTAVMATGNIKRYQMIVASINLLNFPVSWLVLFIWPNPYLTVVIMIILSIVAFYARLKIANEMLGLPIILFVKDVMVPVGKTLLLIVLFGIFSMCYIPHTSRLYMVLLNFVICGMVGMFFIYNLGLADTEKTALIRILKNKLRLG